MTMSIAALMATFSIASAIPPPADLLRRKLIGKVLPDTGEPWATLRNGIQYQPAANLSPLGKEHLRRLTQDDVTQDSFEKIFIDGAETYYDEYSQAWRALGFYIDCDYQVQDEDGSGCQRFMLWAAVSHKSCNLKHHLSRRLMPIAISIHKVHRRGILRKWSRRVHVLRSIDESLG